MEIDDILLYAMGATATAGLSKLMEALNKPKVAKTIDIVFYAGSAALLIKQFDNVVKSVSTFLD